MKIKEAQLHDLIRQVAKGLMSFSRMVEILNETAINITLQSEPWPPEPKGTTIAGIDAKPSEKSGQLNQLQDLMNDISEWSNNTFGDGQRNPAIIYHLKKEVDELINAFKSPEEMPDKFLSVRMEFADCFMLLLDSALHAGITAEELIQVTKEKLEINRNRKWGNPDENGVVEHISDACLSVENGGQVNELLIEALHYLQKFRQGYTLRDIDATQTDANKTLDALIQRMQDLTSRAVNVVGLG